MRGNGGELLQLAVGASELRGALLRHCRAVGDSFLQALVQVLELAVGFDHASGPDQHAAQKDDRDEGNEPERQERR